MCLIILCAEDAELQAHIIIVYRILYSLLIN